MILRNVVHSFFLLSSFVATAGGPFEDHSKAGPDGPYVLYRGQKTVVKSVVLRDSQAMSSTQVYDNKTQITLTCQGPESDDVFSFSLRSSFTIDPSRYELPARMMVLSDIEGNFKAFKTMLLGAKVIDKKFNWTFGKGHVVLLGDFFDRGMHVTECLWLIYKLETEAEAAGGKIHFILGNHEIMNLQGSSQYARKKYVENARLMGETYGRLYDNNSEIGRWLRTKNAVELIGDYVFCHGGISPELSLSDLTLEDVNDLSRKNLGKELKDITNPDAQLVFDMKKGIFWYRNAAKNSVDIADIDQMLDFAQAKRMVVGHTLQPDITAHYNGKVICVDLYHEENMRQGLMKCLWIEDGYAYTLTSKGEKSSIFNVTFYSKSGAAATPAKTSTPPAKPGTSSTATTASSKPANKTPEKTAPASSATGKSVSTTATPVKSTSGAPASGKAKTPATTVKNTSKN